MIRRAGAARALLLLVIIGGCGGEAEKLVEQINAYRSLPQVCSGKTTQVVGPLSPSPALAAVQIGSAQQNLEDALKHAGYSAAQAQAIVVSGPLTASSAMAKLDERYCEVIASAQFSEIGIARERLTWRIVLARPLLSQSLGDAFDAGHFVLELVNKARATARSCGSKRFAVAPPLAWNAKLASAALAHSDDMANRNYFAHRASDGSTVAERAAREGYDWQGIAENIAAGQGSAEQVVAGWLASPGHCENVMQPAFSEMGAAYVVNPKSDSSIYWTQVLGAPRR